MLVFQGVGLWSYFIQAWNCLKTSHQKLWTSDRSHTGQTLHSSETIVVRHWLSKRWLDGLGPKACFQKDEHIHSLWFCSTVKTWAAVWVATPNGDWPNKSRINRIKQSSSNAVWSEDCSPHIRRASTSHSNFGVPSMYTKDLGLFLALGVGSSLLISGMPACRMTSIQVSLHPPKFTIAHEKWWLENYIPIGKVTLQGRTVKLPGG